MRRLPIAFKLATSISILVLLAICALTLVLLNNQSRLIRAHAYDYSTLITEQLANNAVEPLFTDESYQLQALIKKIAASDRILGAAIYDHEGLLVGSDGLVPTKEQLNLDKPYQELMPNGGSSIFSKEQAISVHIEPIRFKGVTAGYAVASYSQNALARSNRQSFALVLSIASALSLVICIIVFRLSRRLTNPINELLKATKNISNGSYQLIEQNRDDEIGELIHLINGISDDLKRKDKLEGLVDQVLTKDVAAGYIDGLDSINNGGEQITASVLFADIVGFTEISERLSPREVSDLLNEYFTYLDSCAKFYFGTIDKFIGDCVMVVFGVPKEDPQHEFHAIACGVLMQKLITRLNEQRRAEGKFTVDLRIGINSGKMLAGMLGSNERREYTVVGDAVNLASRLCNEANESEIIIEHSLYERVNKTRPLTVEQNRVIRVRGKSQPVNIYCVKDVEQINPFIMQNLIEDVISMRNVA